VGRGLGQRPRAFRRKSFILSQTQPFHDDPEKFVFAPGSQGELFWRRQRVSARRAPQRMLL